MISALVCNCNRKQLLSLKYATIQLIIAEKKEEIKRWKHWCWCSVSDQAPQPALQPAAAHVAPWVPVAEEALSLGTPSAQEKMMAEITAKVTKAAHNNSITKAALLLLKLISPLPLPPSPCPLLANNSFQSLTIRNMIWLSYLPPLSLSLCVSVCVCAQKWLIRFFEKGFELMISWLTAIILSIRLCFFLS